MEVTDSEDFLHTGESPRNKKAVTENCKEMFKMFFFCIFFWDLPINYLVNYLWYWRTKITARVWPSEQFTGPWSVSKITLKADNYINSNYMFNVRYIYTHTHRNYIMYTCYLYVSNIINVFLSYIYMAKYG